MTKWQPIDTAPKNGPALVYAPEARQGCEGAWSWGRSLSPMNIVVALCEDGRWTSDIVEFESGWESTGSYTVTVQLQPTHWMPLPEPPAERT